MRQIYLSSPCMCGREMDFVQEAFDTNWVAPLGKNVNEFENIMKEYAGVEAAVAMNAGTAAIHMALRAVGVGQGDVVLCQSMTFSASANPIVYQNGTPVFIDSEPDTWNMSPEALERALKKYPNAKAVVVVHLYGTPAKMDEIIALCKEYNVALIEDAAEGLGGEYKGKKLGSFGDYAIFSFNGNKIITSSGGGMLVGNDTEKLKTVLKWITQSREPAPWYQHEELGYNYRMSNIVAGIGRGQMTVLDDHIEQKTNLYNKYLGEYADIPITMQPYLDNTKPNHWLSAATIDKGCDISPFAIMDRLKLENVETRPIWKPMHMQPYYKDCDYFKYDENCESVCEDIFTRGICLPSDFYPNMTPEEHNEIIKIIKGLFK
ncbi:MAG: aminotransferase class I/II-fold pyridoxal phosphate-dependent enzyme [Eubacteriales bacterium]|nr:aminotransferase class I/II-fold pyridoxal phosphate-dependent enzyme [Eubacteriales bacterium]